MRNLRRIFFAAAFLLLPAIAFAQEDGPPEVEPINYLLYAALAINAALVPLAADALKRVWGSLPTIVLTLVPMVAGALIMMAEAALADFFPVPIDLDLIEQILLGGAGGMASTVAFRFGETHGRH